MRSHTRTEEQMLANDAKRFPILAELLERVHILTDEEIDAAALPLPWYKKALKKLREKMKDKLASQQMFEAKLLEIEPYLVNGTTADPIGEVREWVSGDRWVELGKGHILISDGKHVWFPKNGGVWYETLFDYTAVNEMKNGSRTVSNMTKSQYTEFYKDVTAKNAGLSLYSDDTPKPAYRIYRH